MSVPAHPNKIQCFVQDEAWQRMITRMADLTMRYPHTIVRNIARDYTRTAAQTTRLAKNVKFKKILTEKKETLWIPVSPPRKPRGYGFARMGWFKSLDNLGVKMKRPNKQKFLGAGIFEVTKTRFMDAVTVGNAVPYIINLDTVDGIDNVARRVAWYFLEKNVRVYERRLGALA